MILLTECLIPLRIVNGGKPQIFNPKNEPFETNFNPHFSYLYPALVADLLENWHLPLTDFMQRVETYYGLDTRLKLDRDSVVTRQSLRVSEWHLYGSSRLGIYKTQDTLRTVDLSLVYKLSDVNMAPTQTLTKKEFYFFDSTYTHKRGDKLFEGSNHLGNVLVTFSDKRLATCTEGQVHYQADVRSATDYAAFGALLDDRQWYSDLDSGVYRAGFNGMEKDNEVKGVGNSMVFEYRIHDTRLGRFLSVDPLKDSYPWNSTYAFAENVVLRRLDLEGAEVFDPQTGQSGPWNPNYLHGNSKEFESLLGGLYMPEFVIEGIEAHRAFKEYFRRLDPSERFWRAERAISAIKFNRPDFVYI